MAALFDSSTAVTRYVSLAAFPTRYMWGEVVFNNDPKGQWRLKVKIEGLIPFDDHKKLPWVYPVRDHVTRGTTPAGDADVPVVTSWVLCFFPYNSIYHGFYIY